jgi:hypothetical protein
MKKDWLSEAHKLDDCDAATRIYDPRLTSVPERLKALGKLYQERNTLYGDNYKQAGTRFTSLFTEGITLKSPNDFTRFALLVHIDNKISRYAQAWAKTGKAHPDSLDDLAVYSQMLQEVDNDKID